MTASAIVALIEEFGPTAIGLVTNHRDRIAVITR